MAIAECSRGHGEPRRQVSLDEQGDTMSSARDSLSRLEQCFAAHGSDEGRFAAILARVKKHVKEAEQLAMMHTMASGSFLDSNSEQSMLSDLLNAATVVEEEEEEEVLDSGQVRCQQLPAPEIRAAARPELLARPDLSLRDLADIAARRDDISDDRGCNRHTGGFSFESEDQFAKQDESVVLEDVSREGDAMSEYWPVHTDGRSVFCESILGEGVTGVARGTSETLLQNDVCSSTGRSPRSCVTEAPTRPDDVLAGLMAQAYRNADVVDCGKAAQAVQKNSRVHALYNDTWYTGTVVEMPDTDEQRRYAVQCDCDKQGTLLYTSNVLFAGLFAIPDSDCAEAANAHDSPSALQSQPTNQIALLEQRLEDLERQMALDVQEVASLATFSRHSNMPSLSSSVQAPATKPSPDTFTFSANIPPFPSVPSLRSSETVAHRKVEARRIPADIGGTTREVGDAACRGASSLGEAAREAAARELAAMKEAAATLSASAAACKAAVSSPLLPEFSEQLPPVRDIDPAPLTAWAEDAYSQVVGLGGLDSRQVRSTPVVQSYPAVAKKDLSLLAHEPAESVSTAISSSPAVKSASSWRCVASSPDSGSFRASSPHSPVFSVAQRQGPDATRPAQNESSAFSASGSSILGSTPLGSFRLVKPLFECPNAKDVSSVSDTFFDKPAEEWDEKDVCSWMASATSVPKDLLEFVEAQAINGLVLLSLTDEDLEAIPLKKFGHRRLLLLVAKQLRARVCSEQFGAVDGKALASAGTTGTSGSPCSSEKLRPVNVKPLANAAATGTGSPPCPKLGLDKLFSGTEQNSNPSSTTTTTLPPTTTTLPCTSPSTRTTSSMSEAMRDGSSRRGLSASASAHTVGHSLSGSARTMDFATDASLRKNFSAVGLASPVLSPKLSPAQRTSAVSRTTSSPSAFLCNPLLHAQRRSSPERRPPSPVLRRGASPDGRSTSPVRTTRSVMSARPLVTSGTLPDSSMHSGCSRGSLRMSASASARRLGTTVSRQPHSSRPRSPPRAGWTQSGPPRTACKRGSASFTTP